MRPGHALRGSVLRGGALRHQHCDTGTSIVTPALALQHQYSHCDTSIGIATPAPALLHQHSHCDTSIRRAKPASAGRYQHSYCNTSTRIATLAPVREYCYHLLRDEPQTPLLQGLRCSDCRSNCGSIAKFTCNKSPHRAHHFDYWITQFDLYWGSNCLSKLITLLLPIVLQDLRSIPPSGLAYDVQQLVRHNNAIAIWRYY